MTNLHRVATAALLPAALLGLSGCAPAAEAPDGDGYDATLAALDSERACFFTRQIRGFSEAPDDSSLHERIWVDTGINERFLLETTGACPNLDFSMQIGFDNRGGTSVCSGDLETLVIPSTIPAEFDRCPVRVLGRMTEQ